MPETFTLANNELLKVANFSTRHLIFNTSSTTVENCQKMCVFFIHQPLPLTPLLIQGEPMTRAFSFSGLAE
jgi:hypothetical protein